MIDLPDRFEHVAAIAPCDGPFEVGEWRVRDFGCWVPYSPEMAEELTGIPADQLRARFGDTVTIKMGLGGWELRKGQPDHEDVVAQVGHIIAATTPEPEPIKAPTADEIRARIEELSKLLPAGPVPSRVEVGCVALIALRMKVRPKDDPIAWPPPGGYTIGLPIAENTSLPPRVWRVIDSDGDVMREGTV